MNFTRCQTISLTVQSLTLASTCLLPQPANIGPAIIFIWRYVCVQLMNMSPIFAAKSSNHLHLVVVGNSAFVESGATERTASRTTKTAS